MLMPLDTLQKSFLSAIYDKDDTIDPHIKENGISASQRMQIYRNNVLGAINNAMKETYETVCLLVGDDFFCYMVEQYVEYDKPSSGDLGEYGQKFPEFITALPQCRSIAYLSDIARLEWLRHLSYSAADHQPMSISQLAQISSDDLERASFEFSPSLFVMESSHPVDVIWEICSQKIANDEESVALPQRGAHLMIYRDGYHLTHKLASHCDYSMLEMLIRGDSVGEAIDQLSAEKIENIDLGQLLSQFFEMNLISEINYR
jgi:hypothetical protein